MPYAKVAGSEDPNHLGGISIRGMCPRGRSFLSKLGGYFSGLGFVEDATKRAMHVSHCIRLAVTVIVEPRFRQGGSNEKRCQSSAASGPH